MESHNNEPKSFSLEIDEEGKAILREMIGWTKPTAIICFVFLFLSILKSFFYHSSVPHKPINASATHYITYYLFITCVVFYPILQLYRFSVYIKTAVSLPGQEKLNKALRYLKNMLVYVCILIILFISLSTLVTVTRIINGA